MAIVGAQLHDEIDFFSLTGVLYTRCCCRRRRYKWCCFLWRLVLLSDEAFVKIDVKF